MMSVHSDCTSCHPEEDDHGTYTKTEYPCWYTLPEAEALKIACLYVLGLSPRNLAITISSAPDMKASSILFHTASNYGHDKQTVDVLDAFDIPRLVRRADGLERQPICAGDMTPLKTPLTKSECVAVEVARHVLGCNSTRLIYSMILSEIIRRTDDARDRAARSGNPVAYEYLLPQVVIEAVNIIHNKWQIIQKCSECPDTRPPLDEEDLS